MEGIDITVRNQQIKFYPKGNKYGFYFEMDNGHGFYTKDMFKVWGRPTKNSCVEVATFYIETMEGRIKTFDSYATK
jgi:hypothetical protein